MEAINQVKCTLSFIFDREKKRNIKKIEKPISMRLYWSAKEYFFYDTGIAVEPKFWDDANKTVSKKHPNSIELNDHLSNLKNSFQKLELTCIQQNVPFNKKYVLEYIDNSNSGYSFVDFAREKNNLELQMKIIKDASWVKQNTIINMMDNFCKETYGEAIDFRHLTKDFIEKMQVWLKRKYADTTIHKYNIQIGKFINYAVKEKYIKENPYSEVKLPKPRTPERKHLTEEELMKYENVDDTLLTENEKDSKYRFLFSCYTGLRIGDNSSVNRKTELLIDKDGNITLDKVTEKGAGTRVILPLNILFGGKPQEIVKKYMELYPDIDTLFPPLAEPTINEKIKTVACHAKIENAMSLVFHMARHNAFSFELKMN